jgi:hypothetical protein
MMTTTNRVEFCDPDLVRHEYERLRANALGEINPAAKLALFLRDGMSAWLQTMQALACTTSVIPPTASGASGDLGADMPGAQIASILTDVILTAGPLAGFGGNR